MEHQITETHVEYSTDPFPNACKLRFERLLPDIICISKILFLKQFRGISVTNIWTRVGGVWFLNTPTIQNKGTCLCGVVYP